MALDFVCLYVCVCITEVGCSGGRTRLVKHNICRQPPNLELSEECSRKLYRNWNL